MQVDFLNLKRINESFGQKLTGAVERTVRSGWYLLHDETEAFEHEFAGYNGVRYCVGVGNGLDALTLVLMAWRDMYAWQTGDEVIVPANTFIATVLAVSRAGLTPVFCEPNRSDALMDVTQLDTLLTERTRCIIPVHLYGQLCDMETIGRFARQHRLLLLEDACQAHGAQRLDTQSGQLKRAGAWGDAAAFSFYPGKNLGALGDGGCVCTNDGDLALRVRQLANYGQTAKYIHDFQGVNSRLDELQAAVLRVKLRRLDADNERRRQIARFYSDHIRTEGMVLPPVLEGDEAQRHVYHLYAVRHPQRDDLQQKLREQGVHTLIHYPVPPHKQRAYAAFAAQSFPEAEAWASEELSLPMSPVLTDEEVEYVVKILNSKI